MIPEMLCLLRKEEAPTYVIYPLGYQKLLEYSSVPYYNKYPVGVAALTHPTSQETPNQSVIQVRQH